MAAVEQAVPVVEVPTTINFSRANVGDYQAGWRALIEGMAEKSEEVAKIFLELVKEHNVPNIRHATVNVTQQPIGETVQSRDYYVVERVYPNGGKATLAVRIGPFGKDLYVEWLHYELGVINWMIIILVSLLTCLFTFGAGLIISIPGLVIAIALGYIRRELTHFEKQDSWAMRAVVDTCLKQAIDQAGIAKELVREVPEGQLGVKQRRII